jgi:transcriptional regulator with XRE-family HTH domain
MGFPDGAMEGWKMPENWYSDTTATFGDRVTAAREAAGMSVADLAGRLGVRNTTVEDWEADQSDPRANRMQMLAGILNVSLIWLMTGEGPGIPEPGEAPDTATPAELAAIRTEVLALRDALLTAADRAGRLERRLSLASPGAAPEVAS